MWWNDHSLGMTFRFLYILPWFLHYYAFDKHSALQTFPNAFSSTIRLHYDIQFCVHEEPLFDESEHLNKLQRRQTLGWLTFKIQYIHTCLSEQFLERSSWGDADHSVKCSNRSFAN